MKTKFILFGVFVVAVAIGLTLGAHSLRAQADSSTRQMAHDIFKQLVEINTTDSVGNTTTAADAMAAWLRGAGFTGSRHLESEPQLPGQALLLSGSFLGRRVRNAGVDVPCSGLLADSLGHISFRG